MSIVLNGGMHVIPPYTPIVLSPALKDVRVWLIDLTVDDNDLDELIRLLDIDERARAARFVRTHLSRRFVASHAALRILLGGALGIAPEAVRFRYGIRGKAALAGELAASEMTFNLSHSGEAALIAIAERRAVGVDLEDLRRDVDFELLTAHSLAQAEYAWISSLPPESRREAFYTCWTAKEAYIKARGDGLSFGLKDFETLPDAESDGLRLTVYKTAVESARWTLTRLSLPPGWIGALAVEASATGAEVNASRF
jgi:4'-phosphopantetheinyl transferase